MATRYLVILLILNLSNIQAHLPDSLLAVSHKLSDDTSRVNFFYKQGFENRTIDPQYSFECAQLALKFAQQTSLPYFVAKANSLLGVLFFRQQNFTKALFHHKKALQLREKISDRKGIAISQTNLGNIYSEFKYYRLAETAYLKALEMNSELQDAKQIAVCMVNLGVLSVEQKKYSVAKNYFINALANSKMRFDYEIEALCLNNLSVINIALNETDEAIANCLNSIKTKELMDNEMEMADSYLNLALAYLKKGDKTATFQNLVIADSIIKKFNYTEARLNSLKIKSEFYASEKSFDQAFVSLSQYELLKDSLQLIEKNIDLRPDFTEEQEQEIIESKDFSFPYIYLNILIVSATLVLIFVFKPNT